MRYGQLEVRSVTLLCHSGEDDTFVAEGEAPDLTEVHAQLDMDRVRVGVQNNVAFHHYKICLVTCYTFHSIAA